MTFADAVNSLYDGRAAKRTSWRGYVSKTVTSASGASVETYKLTFKNRAGTSYEYQWNGTSWTAPSTTVPFDADIMAAMIADDWMIGKASDFEAALDNTGTW